MKFLITIISLFFLIAGCTDINKKIVFNDTGPIQQVEDDVMYEFLNSCVFNDSVNKYSRNAFNGNFFLPYFLSKTDSLEILNYGNIFSNDDANFMYLQDRFSLYFKIKDSLINSEKEILYAPNDILSNDTLRHIYNQKILNSYDEVTVIQMPLFSKDKKTVIVSIGIWCGSLCGERATYVFRKTDIGWTIIEIDNKGVS